MTTTALLVDKGNTSETLLSRGRGTPFPLSCHVSQLPDFELWRETLRRGEGRWSADPICAPLVVEEEGRTL